VICEVERSVLVPLPFVRVCADDYVGYQTTLPVLENAFSQRINAIIGKVREARRGPYYVRPPLSLSPTLTDEIIILQPHLYIVKEDGEPSLRQWALSLLIEDRMDQLPSYNQWIGQLKDKVNDK
jgi:protein transport protein SEC24